MTKALLLLALLTSPFLSLSCWPEGACSPWHSEGKGDTQISPHHLLCSLSELPNLRCTSGCHLL